MIAIPGSAFDERRSDTQNVPDLARVLLRTLDIGVPGGRAVAFFAVRDFQ